MGQRVLHIYTYKYKHKYRHKYNTNKNTNKNTNMKKQAEKYRHKYNTNKNTNKDTNMKKTSRESRLDVFLGCLCGTVDPTRLPFQYPVQILTATTLLCSTSLLHFFHLCKMYFVGPPCFYFPFYLHFLGRQFHGVRFYALPGLLPRTMEDKVNTMIKKFHHYHCQGSLTEGCVFEV